MTVACRDVKISREAIEWNRWAPDKTLHTSAVVLEEADVSVQVVVSAPKRHFYSLKLETTAQASKLRLTAEEEWRHHTDTSAARVNVLNAGWKHRISSVEANI